MHFVNNILNRVDKNVYHGYRCGNTVNSVASPVIT